MSAIAILLLAHTALAGSRPPPQPPPPHRVQPVAPVRTATQSHRSQPVHSGARSTQPASGVLRQPITQAAPIAPAAPGGHRRHHHQRDFYGPPCVQSRACDGYGYRYDRPPDAYDVNPPPVERWDDPVDESIPGFDEPTEPAAPIDCDGGATDFQVDDGDGGPAFYRWVDRDGTVNYTDEASVPDWARATAKRTSGDPITIAPRGACQGVAHPGN